MLREEVHNKKMNEYLQNIDRNINIYSSIRNIRNNIFQIIQIKYIYITAKAEELYSTR